MSQAGFSNKEVIFAKYRPHLRHKDFNKINNNKPFHIVLQDIFGQCDTFKKEVINRQENERKAREISKSIK